jgi:hypothetical protein
MLAFQNKYQANSEQEMQARYQRVLDNINAAMKEIENRDYNYLQKRTLNNALEYLRLRIQESMK